MADMSADLVSVRYLVDDAEGWKRIHLMVDDGVAEVAELRAAGVTFGNDIVGGTGGQQTLLEDPPGNVVEPFEAAFR